MAKIEDALKESKLETAINKQNKMIQPLLDTKNRINNMVQPALEAQERLNSMTEPFRKTQAEISMLTKPLQNNQLMKAIEPPISINFDTRVMSGFANELKAAQTLSLNSSLENFKNALTPLISSINTSDLLQATQVSFQNAIAPMLESFGSQKMIQAQINFLSSISSAISKIGLDFRFDYLENIRNSFSGLSKIIESYSHTMFSNYFANWGKIFEFQNLKFSEKLYLNTMYESQWFPYFTDSLEHTELYGIFDIVHRTKPSKSRKNQINRFIFNSFNKTKLNNMKKEWRKTVLNNGMKKLLCQAIDSYNDKKYGLTVSAIVPMWERIITQMANEPNKFKSKEVKQCFDNLLDNNDIPKVIDRFFDSFLMGTCYSISEISTEYPKRDAVAHGWFENYPTRKMALNAILFTDFLLRLESIENEGTSAHA